MMIDAVSVMRRANEISKLGLGKSAPNPIVGAVIIGDDGQIIGEGFHHSQDGGAHAEVVALDKAGVNAIGATLFVTLEPCNHQGKTPPCSEAIMAAGIKRVIYAVADPNPTAQGATEKLRSAGIKVEQGVLAKEVSFTNRAWLSKIKSGRPYITIKVASTLDGRIAAADGSSKWITHENSRADSAILRSYCDAIITGTGTVIADDPSLTVREVDREGFEFKPIRVVIGERLIPAGAKILDLNAETLEIKSHDLNQLLELAGRREWNQILVEAGPKLTTAFLKAGLFDEIYLYQAPTLLGGSYNFTEDLGIKNLSQRLDLELLSAELLGDKGKNLKLHLLAVSR
jgi:diaminohydroxyphosphoribosylaminopyrimidine deaminase/5-amino-6-(5-phosphoribosylamino)uracil reductase